MWICIIFFFLICNISFWILIKDINCISVHELRPYDVKVVAALGDSITVCIFVKSLTIFLLTEEYNSHMWLLYRWYLYPSDERGGGGGVDLQEGHYDIMKSPSEGEHSEVCR